MIQVVFEYPLNGKMVKILAECKSVMENDLENLTLTFLDGEDAPMKVDYDADVFEDIEDEATLLLADAYYNPELNFESKVH